jgi:HD-like signal output (HDOD) protein
MNLADSDDRLSRILRRVNEVPSFPPVVERLLELREEDQSPRSFANLVATDQGLSAKVLRLANSAFFSLKAPVLSIAQASSILGVRTLRSLAHSVSVMSVLRRPCGGFDPLSFWRHSLGCALAGRRIAELLLPPMADHLHIAGLLHDMGIGLLAHYFPEEYSRILERANGRNLGEVELCAFGTTHAELAYALACRWRLPGLVCDCIRLHEPAGARPAPAPATPRDAALEIMRFADAWTAAQGFGFPPGEAGPADLEVTGPLAEATDDLRRILQAIPAELRELESQVLCEAGAAAWHGASR